VGQGIRGRAHRAEGSSFGLDGTWIETESVWFLPSAAAPIETRIHVADHTGSPGLPG